MQTQVGAYLWSVKTRTIPDGPELNGIVAFPSFHVILAILATRALWGIGKLRVCSAVLCVGICISTVATGWHYVIDVFAGIAVAIISQMIAVSVLRTQVVAGLPFARMESWAHAKAGGLVMRSALFQELKANRQRLASLRALGLTGILGLLHAAPVLRRLGHAPGVSRGTC